MNTKPPEKPATKPARKKPGPRPKDRPHLKPIYTHKGTVEFGEWTGKLAEFMRLSKASLYEHALVEIAQRVGFPEKPPLRS